jgi:hydrogenase nickel incorporation protein HypB
MTHRVKVEQKVLSENDRLASELRRQFREQKTVVLNLVSSPGSGKTTLLEKTLAALNTELKIAVIAGDVQTENDANRLSAAGGRIVQPIVTGGKCHLDAKMISDVVARMNLKGIELLFIENVGNLVCPSSYDLGEDMKVVLVSTTEGDDKPMKYPGMFRRSVALVVNKTDLLGTSEFSLGRVQENALNINGALKIFEVSCRSGDGLDIWYQWLKELVHKKRNGEQLT